MQKLGCALHVLVAPAREVDDHAVALFQEALHLQRGEGVGGLERRDEPLALCQPSERIERLGVRRRDVFDPAGVL